MAKLYRRAVTVKMFTYLNMWVAVLQMGEKYSHLFNPLTAGVAYIRVFTFY